MTPMAPVSVVVPCWKCGDTITRAVESVAAQSYLPREVILVDDASGDGTLEVLHALAARYSDGWIKVVEQERNAGPGEARNAGWAVATSRYIAFLDADDAWHSKKLELQLAWMEAHPEAAITGTQTIVLDPSEKTPQVAGAPRVKEVSFRHMLLVNRLLTRSVVLRANVPHRFLPGKRYSEDYLLWLSMIADGYRAFLLDMPLAYAFKRDFGIGGLSAHLWNFHRDVLDTYDRLYEAGHINGVTRILLAVYSFFKFARRWALSVN